MKNILAVRNDRFGEFLLNIPAFRALKETFPGARLTVAVSGSVAPLVRAVPFIDEVIVWPDMPWGLDALWAAAMDLRRRRFDAAVVLNPSAAAHQAVFLAGIPCRAGYDRKHPFLLTRRLKDEKGLGKRHEVDNNLDVALLLGAATTDRSLVLALPAENGLFLSAAGLSDGNPFVVIHPWTSDPVKQWPLERFRELTVVVAAWHKVVILGRPETWHDGFDARRIPNVVDLSGKTTLLEAAAVLQQARALVSCDSGPVHLAACVGTPVVALFRNDLPGKNPERWGPWGKGHMTLQSGRLEGITVKDVAAALESLLKANA